MQEYLGLLVSITDGSKIPKRRVFLTVLCVLDHLINIDSLQQIHCDISASSGRGEVAHFDQGYFFRNYRAGGHDESDLPLLIQLSEKRGMRKP